MLQGIRSKFMSYFAHSCSLLESFNRFRTLTSVFGRYRLVLVYEIFYKRVNEQTK